MNRITRADIIDAYNAANNSENLMDMYQRIATRSAIYPGQGTSFGLVYVALKGCGESGEFAEHVGKAMRDDALMSGQLTPKRRDALIKEIGDELWYLVAKCNELGITLSEAALVNLEKLCDRTERDVLCGSGDDR